jgi:hypothetical protein
VSPPDEDDTPDSEERGPDRQGRIEAATTAWRPLRRDGIGSHPSWEDLDEEGRKESFERTLALRQLEAAADPEGRSTTVLAVLARIRGPR